jgi:O-antigen/teichoic acid export membrane protein
MSRVNTPTQTSDLPLITPRLFLRRGSFSANVLTLSAGTTLSQGLNAAGTLLLARVFVPEAFGMLALFMAITTFLSAIAGWRYETAIMLPEKEEEAANLQVLAFFIVSGMCAFSLVCVALFRDPVARMLGEPRLAPWLWGVPVSLLSLGLYQILSYWASRMKHFHLLAVSRVSQTVGIIGSQLGLFGLGFDGPRALVFGWIAGQCVGTGILGWRAAIEEGGFVRRSFQWALVRSGLFKYKNFPIYTAPYSFIGNAARQFIFVVLRLFADIHVVGLFSMARRIVSLPISLITVSMAQVFYEKAATELNSGRLEPFVLRILKLQVALGTPFLVFFAFEAKLLFGVVLGRVWASSGVYAALLAFSGYMEFVISWMEKVFDVKGRQNLVLAWEISRDIVVIGSLVIALGLTGNPVFSVGVYVGLDFLCSVAWLLLAFKVADFELKKLWQVGGLFLGIGAAAIAMLAPVHYGMRAWQAFFLSSALVLATEGFIFVRYSRGSRLV